MHARVVRFVGRAVSSAVRSRATGQRGTFKQSQLACKIMFVAENLDRERWTPGPLVAPRFVISNGRFLPQNPRHRSAVERQRKDDEEKAAQEARKTADEHAKVEAALTSARMKTFRACAEEYERAHRLEWTNPAFRDSWLRSLEIRLAAS